jgi:hypothetical protein
VKLHTTLAMTAAGGAIAIAGLASPAQAGTAAAKTPVCSVAEDRLVLQFAHGYLDGDTMDQPLSISTQGENTCRLSGRPIVQLLNERQQIIGVYPGAPSEALVGPENQAVFHLTFTTGGAHPVHPAYVRVTVLPHGGTFAPVAWNSTDPSSPIEVGGFKPWLD